jgi:TolB-like protein/DNA-binding SARP family transcriptional activator
VNNITPFARPVETTARTNSASAHVYRVHLVKKMRATGPNGENILPKPKKTQALLAYLCLANGELLSRDQVAGLMWDQAETQARNSLRHALQDLARLGWPLERRHETVRLDIKRCWIDALEGPHRADLLLASLHGVSAPFDEWLAEERSRLERRWQSALEAELEDLVARKATPAHRAEAARRLQSLMPTHDYAVRNLMIAYADMGESANAIREYERFRMFINRSIGVLPSEPTVVLAETIRLASRKRPSLSMSQYDDVLSEKDRDPVRTAAKRSMIAHPHPSIAVLLRNLSGHDDNLVEGLVEDLIERLSRVPGLFVMSRLSAAAFRNQDRLPHEISDALGVRYLLLGSMRVIGDHLRLNVELTDVSTDTALWRDRRDEKFSDLLEVQDRLADRVVRAVAAHLRLAEVSRVRTKRPEDYNAYDLFLRGQESMHNPSREAFESAENLFRSAIHRQPRYAAAMAWLAHWHVLRVGQGWSPDSRHDTAQADYFAQQAVECDASEPTAYAVQGHVAAYLHRDFDLAFARFETALRINPNSARAWLWSAYANAWFNQGSIAVKNVERAIALSPYDPLIFTFTGGAALAHMADRQYNRAIEFALRCMQENPSYITAHKVLICCLVLSRREAEARNAAHELLLLEPGFTVEKFRRSPASFGALGELYCGAFARVGVPLSG